MLGDKKIPDRMLRRVEKELDKSKLPGQIIDSTYLYMPITLYPSLQKRAEANNVDPALIITLGDYPWKPPNVSFCATRITAIYRCEGAPNILTEMEKIMGKPICLCCDSVLCPNNWSSCCTISDIVSEFQLFTTLKARAVERIMCDNLQENLFSTLVDADGIPNCQTLPLKDYRISDFL